MRTEVTKKQAFLGSSYVWNSKMSMEIDQIYCKNFKNKISCLKFVLPFRCHYGKSKKLFPDSVTCPSNGLFQKNISRGVEDILF